jgi:DNA-binding IclR family transcriptional regulator
MNDKAEQIYTYIREYHAAHGGISPIPSDIATATGIPEGSIYLYIKDLVIDGRLYFRVKGKYYSLTPASEPKQEALPQVKP